MTTDTVERPPVAAEFNPIQDGQRLMKAWYAGLEPFPASPTST